MSVGQEQIHQGVPASPGIAIAALFLNSGSFDAPLAYDISEHEVAAEQQRFLDTLEYTKLQLKSLKQKMSEISQGDGGSEAEIFEAHLMLLEDRTVLKRVKDTISTRLKNAETCFFVTMQNYLEVMRRISDSYLRERIVDIEDITSRVLTNFSPGESNSTHSVDHEHILISQDISPSETAEIDRTKVLGFATEQGSINSHTSILARALGIPAIVGLNTSIIDLMMHTPAILDGYTGKLILNPSDETRIKYQEILKSKQLLKNRLHESRDKETMTSDGKIITVSSNLELLSELDEISHSGAKGIGLYRTEFLLLNERIGTVPTESEQTTAYSEVVKAMSPHLVIIRTLDAGGDKLPYEAQHEPEANPFLGWRGIRVSLDRPDMFRTQIRAILQASAFGKTGVMFPLVSGVSEVLKGREMISRCMDGLSDEGIAFDSELAVGVMMEVPSAAVCADMIAPHVDFFSIGTNDLIQYTVAVDRGNPHVMDLYRSTHPAVIRLIDNIVRAGKNQGIWTGVCGEMAGDIRLTPLLLGLGVEELSVSPLQVPRIGHAIRTLDLSDCSSLTQDALKMTRSSEILEISESYARQYYPDLF